MMSPSEPGKALANRGTGIDDAIAERVIRRDRWAVRLLAGLAIVFWMLSAMTVIGLYWAVLVWIVPILVHFADAGPAGIADSEAHWAPVFYFIIRIGWPAAIVGGTLAVLAAICTVVLVQWSRRATLRLVDRRLAEILAELRKP
jgi:hypothetical protein